MMGDSAIELRDLVTGYSVGKSKKIISGPLNVALRKGRFTALLGPNGSGKSTLLRTIAGFQAPLAGDVIIGDSKGLLPSDACARSKELSIVLTERPTLEDITVEELVALGRAPYTGFWGTLSNIDSLHVKKAMALTGIEGFADRDVNSLSDGERQKAMVAKALAQDTMVILLDEATAFLDYPSKLEILLLLRKLAHEEGRAILLSTHDLELALQCADDLWLLDKTKGFTYGPSSELISSGTIAEYFDRPGLHFDANTHSFRISDTSN